MCVSINVLGTCVSRDVFGLFPNDGGFLIKKCVMNSNLVSACSEKISDEIICSPDDFVNTTTNFVRRCAALDINKKVFDFMAEEESDYLVADLGILHCTLFKIKKPDNSITYITETKGLRQNPDVLADKDIELLETMPFSEKYLDIYRDYLKIYVEKMKSLISEEKIIILETNLSLNFLNQTGKLIPMASRFSFSAMDLSPKNIISLNKVLSIIYDDLHKLLPKAHFVPMPLNNVPSNIKHRWGFSPFHYVFEVYEYFLESIRIITSNAEDEAAKISKLKEETAKNINRRYFCDEYNIKNLSMPVKKNIHLGEPLKLKLDSESNFGKCRYTIQYKLVSEKDWLLERTTSDYYGILPLDTGEYNLCIKAIDKNNIIAKKYFRFNVLE